MGSPRARLLGRAVSSVLLLVMVLPGLGGLARGEESDSREDFPHGIGGAEAFSLRVVPRSSGLSIPVTFGKAAAAWEGVLARAESTVYTLGSIGASLGGACGEAVLGGAAGGLEIGEPITMLVTSRNGETRGEDQVTDNGGAVVGRQAVHARPGAYGHAINLLGRAGIEGVLELSAGYTEAQAELNQGVRRRAESLAEIGRISLAGGLVQLTGLRWTVEHATGEDEGLRGSFEIGEILLLGQQLPSSSLEELHSSMDQINGLLGPMGGRLELPVVEELQDGQSIRVTPLRLVVGQQTVLIDVLGEIFAAIQPLRDVLIPAIRDLLSCETVLGELQGYYGIGVLLADIVLGAFAGVASVDLEVGGVRATTDGTAFENPLAELPPPATGQGLAAEPVAGGGEARSATVSTPGEETLVAGSFVPGSERCERLFQSRSCLPDRGWIAALGAALVMVVLGATELVRSRRTRTGAEAS